MHSEIAHGRHRGPYGMTGIQPGSIWGWMHSKKMSYCYTINLVSRRGGFNSKMEVLKQGESLSNTGATAALWEEVSPAQGGLQELHSHHVVPLCILQQLLMPESLFLLPVHGLPVITGNTAQPMAYLLCTHPVGAWHTGHSWHHRLLCH